MMKYPFFCDTTLRHWATCPWRFEIRGWFYVPGWKRLSPLMMKPLKCIETSGTIYLVTRHHIPEEGVLNIHRCGNLTIIVRRWSLFFKVSENTFTWRPELRNFYIVNLTKNELLKTG